MGVHVRPVAGTAGLLLVVGVLAAPAPAGALHHAVHAQAAATVVGAGHAAPARSVTVSAANARARRQAQPRAMVPAAPLGRDGRPAGSALPTRAASGARPSPRAARLRAAGAANSGRTARPGRAIRATTAAASGKPRQVPAAPAAAGFGGLSEGGSDCTNCLTPDVTAAVSGTEIAETVNLSMQVDSKSGTTLCTVSLASLLGAVTGLSRPRIQYDNASNRFSLVVDSVPGSAFDVPIQYLATSQTSDACGAWWVYSVTFTPGSTDSLYPLGALLDYPYLGQDGTSLLASTNNFSFGGSYLGSAAYAIPKAVAYTGNGFSFTTYQVAFSTAPVTVAGIPAFATTNTYWVAAVPGTGYDLYVMPTNPAGAITLQATIRSPFSAPSRRVRQPGTSQTLDPLDGRIESAAVQDGDFVWFAHGVDDAGFPTVRYGAIDVTDNRASTALAFHGGASDDFNPSIGVSDAGGDTNFIWVNWAYTDSGNGVPVSDTVAGVAPGQGVPELDGADLTLVRGSSTSAISTFGGYSSAEIDPVSNPSGCPAGETALTAQEYFTGSGTWTTRLAETTFC
jgi:hypothetical protein